MPSYISHAQSPTFSTSSSTSLPGCFRTSNNFLNPSTISLPQNQLPTTQPLYSEYIPILNLLYSTTDISAAISLLKRSGRHHTLPRNALHLAEAHFVRYVITGNERDRKALTERVRKAEMLAESCLERKDLLDLAFHAFNHPTSSSPSLSDTAQTNQMELRRPKSAQSLTQAQAPPSATPGPLLDAFILDVKCCMAESLMMKGWLEMTGGREIKGSL